MYERGRNVDSCRLGISIRVLASGSHDSDLPIASTGAPSLSVFCSVLRRDLGNSESIRFRRPSVVPPDCINRCIERNINLRGTVRLSSSDSVQKNEGSSRRSRRMSTMRRSPETLSSIIEGDSHLSSSTCNNTPAEFNNSANDLFQSKHTVIREFRTSRPPALQKRPNTFGFV